MEFYSSPFPRPSVLFRGPLLSVPRFHCFGRGNGIMSILLEDGEYSSETRWILGSVRNRNSSTPYFVKAWAFPQTTSLTYELELPFEQ